MKSLNLIAKHIERILKTEICIVELSSASKFDRWTELSNTSAAVTIIIGLSLDSAMRSASLQSREKDNAIISELFTLLVSIRRCYYLHVTQFRKSTEKLNEATIV